jgi:hypothetical protein
MTKVFTAGEVLTAADVNTYLVNTTGSGNAIINGAFDIWQRGTSFSSGYTADRFLDVTGGGGTNSITRESFTSAELLANGFGESAFYLRHARTGGTFAILEQRIEDVRTFSGETVTLSYYAKVSSGTITNEPVLVQHFGSGGGSDVSGSSQSATLTTSWQRFVHTFQVASTAGKTVGAGSFLRVRPLRHVSATGATIDIWGVQLEAGTVATPFRRNANSLQGELAASQRYYQNHARNSGGRLGFVYFDNSTTPVCAFPLPVEMRTTPSGSITDIQVRHSGTTDVTATAITVTGQPTNSIIQFTLTVASGPSAGSGGMIRASSASSKIELSAEL